MIEVQSAVLHRISGDLQNPPVSVLLIDNFDSFTFNLVDDLRRRGCNVEVWRNSVDAKWAIEHVQSFALPRLIVLSPGPGRPEEAGCCEPLVREAIAARVPIFGVCLGLQSMVTALGGRVGGAGQVVHGKTAWVDHDQSGLFAGLATPQQVGRYHSLVATSLPDELTATAHYGDLIMAIEHREAPLCAVQFHPESLLTPSGAEMMDTLLRWARAAAAAPDEQQKESGQ